MSVRWYICGRRTSRVIRQGLLYRSAESCGIERGQLTIVKTHSHVTSSQNPICLRLSLKGRQEIKQREELLAQLQEELNALRDKENSGSTDCKGTAHPISGFDGIQYLQRQVTLKDLKESERIFVLVKWLEPVDDEVVTKLQKWLCVRLETENITVIQDKQ